MRSLFAAVSVLCALACGAVLPRLGQVIAHRVFRETGEPWVPPSRTVHRQHRLLSIMCAYALNAACLMAFGMTWTAEAAFVFCSALFLASLIDRQHHLLPDLVTLSLLWLGLLVNVPGTFASSQDAILGAVAGYLGLRTISIGSMAATGQEGIGGGDFKLLAAIGAWLGWDALVPVVLMSAGFSVARGLWLQYRGDKNARIAYGPGLAVGALTMLFYHAPSFF